MSDTDPLDEFLQQMLRLRGPATFYAAGRLLVRLRWHAFQRVLLLQGAFVEHASACREAKNELLSAEKVGACLAQVTQHLPDERF